jgi:hypothetical protein
LQHCGRRYVAVTGASHDRLLTWRGSPLRASRKITSLKLSPGPRSERKRSTTLWPRRHKGGRPHVVQCLVAGASSAQE